ncbi:MULTISPECIES: PTS sugar transporter subunit IIB [unclassified Thomasclavelia]|uniref:PTS sugar transporter subunit IIB n=1 Tax=unclassified Thomasclavelia TaxID=3025756 RepID=UPI002600E5F5|nr:PTS sugar transporter subunit IIB [Thomasclavelia sp.]
MLKILICCGGGFSSSYVTERMKKEIVEKNLENEVNIEFYPFAIVEDKLSDVDIIMCCPHLKIYVEQFIDKTNVDIPIYLLPPKMYGLMKLEEILTDAKDVIKLYQKNKTNPVHFPNEENLLRITRGNAYRHYYKIDGEL